MIQEKEMPSDNESMYTYFCYSCLIFLGEHDADYSKSDIPKIIVNVQKEHNESQEASNSIDDTPMNDTEQQIHPEEIGSQTPRCEEAKQMNQNTDNIDRNKLYDPSEFGANNNGVIKYSTRSHEDGGRLLPISKKSSPTLQVNFPEII